MSFDEEHQLWRNVRFQTPEIWGMPSIFFHIFLYIFSRPCCFVRRGSGQGFAQRTSWAGGQFDGVLGGGRATHAIILNRMIQIGTMAVTPGSPIDPLITESSDLCGVPVQMEHV